MSSRQKRLTNKSRQIVSRQKIKKHIESLENWRDLCFRGARSGEKKSEFCIDAQCVLTTSEIQYLESHSSLPKWALKSDDFLNWVKETTPDIYEKMNSDFPPESLTDG